MTPAQLDKAKAYADRRHRETGRRYIVSCMGHAMMDCKDNRAMLRDLTLTVIYRSTR